MSFVLCSILRSTESVKLPVIISLITSGFNIFFNYGLIGGNLGFPRMETAGAALATTIANWLGLLVLIVICMVQKNILRAPVKELLAFRWHNVAHFLRKAVPVICNESIWALGTVVMNAILSNIGDEYYAGVTILRTVENVAFVFAVGLCNACAILVGKAVGAGNIREAKETSLRFSFVMPLFSILTSACLILLRCPIVDLFTMNGEYSDVSVRTAVMCITTYACILPFRNVPYLNIVGVFRPAGDPRTGLICDMIPLWLIAIPVTAVMAFVVKLPFNLVFLIMYLCEDIPKASICIGYYLTDKWIRPVTEEGKAALEVFKAEKAAKKKRLKITDKKTPCAAKAAHSVFLLIKYKAFQFLFLAKLGKEHGISLYKAVSAGYKRFSRRSVIVKAVAENAVETSAKISAQKPKAFPCRIRAADMLCL